MSGKGFSPKEVEVLLGEQLGGAARRRNKRLDRSVFTELSNYSSNEEVRDLPREELANVLTRMGELAVRLPAGDVGGGQVRQVIFTLCPTLASTCRGSAEAVLRDHPGGLGEYFTKSVKEKRLEMEELEASVKDTDLSFEPNDG